MLFYFRQASENGLVENPGICIIWVFTTVLVSPVVTEMQVVSYFYEKG